MLSSSLEIIPESTISGKLPLYNNIIEKNNKVTIQAASTRCFISEAVGDQSNEVLVGFDVVLQDPSKITLINISPGEGITRDGLNDRYGSNLTKDIVRTINYASRPSADLQIKKPRNEDVDSYKITIMAIDQEKESIEKQILIKVNNINQRPEVIKDNFQLLGNWISKTRKKITESITSIKLFDDPDLIHDDKLSIEIAKGQDGLTEYSKVLEGVKLDSVGQNGELTISLKPPIHIVDFFQEKFKIKATDSMNETISTDWFIQIFYQLPKKLN